MKCTYVCIAGVALALTSLAAAAQEASARTVQYHSQDRARHWPSRLP